MAPRNPLESEADADGLFKRARPARTPNRFEVGTPERGPWVVILVASTGGEILRLDEGLDPAAALRVVNDPRDWTELVNARRAS